MTTQQAQHAQNTYPTVAPPETAELLKHDQGEALASSNRRDRASRRSTNNAYVRLRELRQRRDRRAPSVPALHDGSMRANRGQKPPREHVAFRLDPDMREKLEALRCDLDTSWKDATISDVLRLVMLTGLEVVYRKRKAGKLRDGLAPTGAVLDKRYLPK